MLTNGTKTLLFYMWLWIIQWLYNYNVFLKIQKDLRDTGKFLLPD